MAIRKENIKGVKIYDQSEDRILHVPIESCNCRACLTDFYYSYQCHQKATVFIGEFGFCKQHAKKVRILNHAEK